MKTVKKYIYVVIILVALYTLVYFLSEVFSFEKDLTSEITLKPNSHYIETSQKIVSAYWLNDNTLVLLLSSESKSNLAYYDILNRELKYLSIDLDAILIENKINIKNCILSKTLFCTKQNEVKNNTDYATTLVEISYENSKVLAETNILKPVMPKEICGNNVHLVEALPILAKIDQNFILDTLSLSTQEYSSKNCILLEYDVNDILVKQNEVTIYKTKYIDDFISAIVNINSTRLILLNRESRGYIVVIE